MDVEELRSHFPALEGGAAHFDGPGGSQTPDVVADTMRRVMTAPLANQGEGTAAERNALEVVREARRAVADLVGADPAGVVFGRSMTALTFDMARTLATSWGPGDEVVVSRLDHDANIRPWVLAAAGAGATVRWADFDPETGELSPASVAEVLGERTRLVAHTAASNLIGTVPDVAAIGRLAHAAGALHYVDGVHYSAHRFVDLEALGADFYACSPYKFLGPHCGVLVARPALLETLAPDKLLPSSDAVPERFELGTLPYELLAGTTAAIDFLAAVEPGGGSRRDRLRRSFDAMQAHEGALRARLESALHEIPGATVYSRASQRTPTVLVDIDGHRAHDLYLALGQRGVNAPAGSFYALEASRRLGLGDQGALRIGLAPYTDDADIDRLLTGLEDCLQ